MAKGDSISDLTAESVFASGPMPAVGVAPSFVPQPNFDYLAAFAARPGEDSAPDHGQDMMQRLRALTHGAQTWKAADQMRPDAVIKGVQGLAQGHGATKIDAARTMQNNQVEGIAAVLKDMSAQGMTPAQPSSGGGLGSAGKGLVADALMTGAASIALGPVGAIGATIAMAARAGMSGVHAGQGSLVTHNQQAGYHAAAPSSRGPRARATDYERAFGSETPSPAVTQNTAPVSTGFQTAMSKGPGFGRADILADMRGQQDSFKDMAMRIAADSPAFKATESMRRDGARVSDILHRQRDGVDATADNIMAAENIGMDVALKQAGPKIQTFHMT